VKMSASNSVKSAHKRLWSNFPTLIKDCGREASLYGECVSLREMPAKDDCLKEFEALKRCFQKSAAERKIKPR